MDELILIQREIDNKYDQLPWPTNIYQLTLITEIRGGLGDISSAAKIINLLQEMSPRIHIDWIITPIYTDAMSFIDNKDRVRINPLIPYFPHLLLVGPSNCMWGTKYIESRFHFKLKGIRFDFLEAGSEPNTDVLACVQNLSGYEQIHRFVFPASHHLSNAVIMGLRPGMGMIFDKNRMGCKSTISELLDMLNDVSLKNNINKFYVDKNNSWSINSGYAHRPNSWKKFIDCVAIHEKSSNVIIILNSRGEFDNYNNADFIEKILDQTRIKFLINLGYEQIIFNNKKICKSKENRKLVIITQPKFSVDNMKIIQLISDRIMCTGNSSVSEAISCGSREWMPLKLYLYEDVANCGVTDNFANQQIEIAKKIYPNFAHLLKIFAFSYTEPNAEQMDKITKILNDKELSKYVYKFCKIIVENYSFDKIFKNSLLRSLWLHIDSKLLDIEISSISQQQREYIMKIISKNKTA